jgi:hypothetical protein
VYDSTRNSGPASAQLARSRLAVSGHPSAWSTSTVLATMTKQARNPRRVAGGRHRPDARARGQQRKPGLAVQRSHEQDMVRTPSSSIEPIPALARWARKYGLGAEDTLHDLEVLWSGSASWPARTA